MNILIDAHVFDDKYQGSRTYLKGLYVALIANSPEWNFYLAAQNISNLKEEFGTFNNLHFLELKKANKFYRLLVDLPRLIRNYNIDYTHFQYTIPPFRRGKYIVTIHDILFEQKEFSNYFPLKGKIVNHILHKFAARRADLLLTVSEFSREKLAEIYKIPLKRIHVTPNAIDSGFERNDTSKPLIRSKYILYVSRVEPRKNHLSLLKAFVQSQLFQDYKLVFIGKRDIKYQDLETYIQQNAHLLQESLIRLESVSEQELVNYYQHCSLFVFPSFAEGFGIPPLEAMAVGAKVLVANTTAMSDFGLPESLMFNPHDLEELKRKINFQLASDFNHEQVYKAVLSKYNWTKISREFKSLLQKDLKKEN